MKEREKNRHFTLMVVPHDAAGRAWVFRIPSFILKNLLTIVLFSILIFSLSIFYSTLLSGKLVHYNAMVSQSGEKDKKIDEFLSDTGAIKRELQSILDQNNELRRLLGLKIEKEKVVIEGSQEESPKLFKIQRVLKSSLKEIDDTKVSFNQLKERVAYIQERMAASPSGWPVYGRLVSFFGYRRSPWRSFHTGIDIDVPYGYPVRATAPGTVTYAGWRTGYGRVVQISHSYGFSTLYAHNSKLMVSPGSRVRKGQIIASVGTTGFTTGAHCHYEVRKQGTPIDPYAFLNLSILSAGRYF
ncbi:peptidoglycan DD-metalloendopeptidase family protein [Candidatus Saganbacteria bacterium]|nr:peptidoglycan DD-metalloendopeptidase family protein [Candidatus Saganbacteria bacterium]